MSDLTPKQQRFVAEYLIDLNGTQAAIRAGYSPNGADVAASRLLGDVRVSGAVQEAQKASLGKLQITADKVKHALAAIGFADPVDFYDEQGQVKPLKDWPKEARLAVKEWRTLTHENGTIAAKFKLADKTPALAILAKHFGLLVEAPAVQVNVLTKVERVIVRGKP